MVRDKGENAVVPPMISYSRSMYTFIDVFIAYEHGQPSTMKHNYESINGGDGDHVKTSDRRT